MMDKDQFQQRKWHSMWDPQTLCCKPNKVLMHAKSVFFCSQNVCIIFFSPGLLTILKTLLYDPNYFHKVLYLSSKI